MDIQRAPSAGSASAPHSADASDGVLDSRELREFIHELANLIDGSMRSVELARRDLDRGGDAPAPIEQAQRRLEAAVAGLGHVAGLIRSISGQLQGLGTLARSRLLDQPRPLHEAIAHAIDLLEPLAHDRAICIHVELDPVLRGLGPTTLYPVIANALRNSIDAINSGGTILLRARREADDQLLLEVLDDGPGPPAPPNGSSVFEFGFSTKPGSSGIGLALARDVVRDLGGSIELTTRWPDRSSPRGAALRVRLPISSDARPEARGA